MTSLHLLSLGGLDASGCASWLLVVSSEANLQVRFHLSLSVVEGSCLNTLCS